MQVFGRLQQAGDENKSAVSKGTALPTTGNDGDLFTLIKAGDDEIYLRKDGIWVQLLLDSHINTKIAGLNPSGKVDNSKIDLQASDVVAALGYTPASTAGVTDILASYTGITGILSGTSIIPADNTTPLLSEGTEVWSQIVTPKTIQSKFIIDQTFRVDCNASSKLVTFAVFRDAECIYATSLDTGTAGRTDSASLHLVDSPNRLAPVVYSLRVGVNAASTWYINVASGNTVTFGGVASSSTWTILEIS